MRIGVFGAGYVGLVTAVCLAEMGHSLQVVELDREKVERLNKGINTIYEPGLDELLSKNVRQGNILFSNDAAKVIRHADILFLCVGTPPKADGHADLSQIEMAIREIIQHSEDGDYKLVVIKSTVPVGTAQKLKEMIRAELKERLVHLEVASNPEFLREGSAVNDFMHPDRIVIGAASDRARTLLESVYAPFKCPKIITDSATAEMIKYASNSFLATKISFINMISDLCEEVGADVTVVAEGMGYDKRIGADFLRAGIGFGGSCFPKDLQAFLHTGKSNGLNFALLEEVIRINEQRPVRMMNKLNILLAGVKGKRIAVLGLAFKAQTDDVRESPSAKLIQLLKEEGASVRATDPMAINNFKRMYGPLADDVAFFETAEEALQGCHAAVIVTDWKCYKELDWAGLRSIMQQPVVLDTRNLLNEVVMASLNYVYESVGKANHRQVESLQKPVLSK